MLLIFNDSDAVTVRSSRHLTSISKAQTATERGFNGPNLCAALFIYHVPARPNGYLTP